MQTSPNIDLRMLHTSEGLEIDYRRSWKTELAAKYRRFVIRFLIVGVAVVLFGGLLYWVGTTENDTTLVDTGGVLSLVGVTIAMLAYVLMFIAIAFPSLRQTKDYNPSAKTRIVIEDEWIVIRDRRLHNRIRRRILCEKLDSVTFVGGAGGTQFGVLILFLIDEDPLELMLRAPLASLREVAAEIASECGFFSEEDDEDWDGWIEDEFFDDDPSGDNDDGDDTLPLFGNDAA